MQRRTPLEMQGRVMSAAEAAITLPYVLPFVVGAVIVTIVPFRTIYLIEATGLALAALYLAIGRPIQPAIATRATAIV